MENQIEKSIEQIALDDYAVDFGWKKSSKLFKFISFFIGLLAAVAFYLSPKFDLFIFPGLVIGLVFYLSCMSYFLLSKKAKDKIISSLSNFEKREIIENYIQIKIIKLQNEIDYLKKEGWQTGEIVGDFSREIFDLKRKILDDPADKDYLETKISKLEEARIYYKKQHDPYRERSLECVSEIRELEIKLESLKNKKL